MSSSSLFVLALLCLSASAALAISCPTGACEAVLAKDGDTLKKVFILQEDGNSTFPPKDLCNCTCDDDGNTLFHLAVEPMCDVCVDVLVNEEPTQCEACPVNVNEDTPLHTSAETCDSVMTFVFGAEDTCDKDARNDDDNTPLCLAMSQNNTDCGGVVKELIEAGASCNATCDGATPLSLAANENIEISYCEVCPDECD